MYSITNIFEAYGLNTNPISDLKKKNESSDFITDCEEFDLQDNSNIGGDRIFGVINLNVDYDYLETALQAAENNQEITPEYREQYIALLAKSENDQIELDNNEYHLVSFHVNSDEMNFFIDEAMNVLLVQHGEVNIPVQEAMTTICDLSVNAAL